MDKLSNQLITRLAQTTLSDAQIQSYGRWLVAAVTVCYMAQSWQKDVPADVQYAITGHMVQGYDRSIISTRLEQCHTRALIQQAIGLNELRQQLRTETGKEAKLRGWKQVFRLTLISIVATTYIHSLTISLLCVKNTVRVLVFLLSRREAAGQLGSRKGAFSTIKAWWTGGLRAGFTGIMMESMLAKMAAQADQQASPFSNAGLEEENGLHGLPTPPPLDGRTAFVQSQQRQEMVEAMHGESLRQVEHAFSVRAVLELAIPRIVACAAAVVDSAIEARPEHLFCVSGIVRASDLRQLLEDIALRMEHCACVAAWVRRPRPFLQPAQPQCSRSGSSPSLPTMSTDAAAKLRSAMQEEEEGLIEDGDRRSASSSEDIVEFPHGSTVMLGPKGRPVCRHSAKRSEERAIDEILGHRLTFEEQAMQEEALRRDHLLKGQMAGFFRELYQSSSFGELCITYAAELLTNRFKEAGDIAHVKTYDASTDTARMAMVIAALDSCRLSALEEECEVKSYMRLFCEETIRSTCAQ
ncbi:hypothetical protein ABL78_3621 [Leptomonas seymouri]|uniref:Uncharacterized protein n=1 Tax=Leptomonas seymouri TaxID=5684 RepID=A0A0N1IL78_LEPSE|nr:hypothetical protein ABL78_3621 [Leptomonas seymouri]|eukprot:KPI87284.1 hypothetical protein ABL78_3621 [Leptomonas seymouri]